MKLSIWQQFSSNHSSSYTVVGEFQSATQANNAFSEVMKIMTYNFNWYVEQEEYPQSRKEPTPVEAQYAQRYNFDWKEPVDWARYDVSRAVSNFDRLVIIDTAHVDTWQTGHQFANLLTSMGAKVARSIMEGKEPDLEDEIWMSLRFNIECEVATANAAQKLREHFQQVFSRNKDFLREKYIPWIVHHPSLIDMNYTSETITQMEQDYADGGKKIRKIREENPKHHNLWADVRKLPHDEWVWFGQLQREVDFYGGINITNNDLKLIFSDVYPVNIAIGLDSFIKYLEHLGGTNIKYTVEQL